MTSRSRRDHMPGLTPAQSDHAWLMDKDKRDAYVRQCRNWNQNRPQAGPRVSGGFREDVEREDERIMREYRNERWFW